MKTALPPDPSVLAPSSAPGQEWLPSITLQAPLIGAESARLALRCGEGRLMEWILSGDLEWGFDFRRAGSRRAHLRILTGSIVRLQQRNRPLMPREKAAQQARPLEPVFNSMFNHHKPHLFSTELARVWNCGTSHIHNLIEDGLLTVLEKDYVPREALRISRQSAFHFMQTRRVK